MTTLIGLVWWLFVLGASWQSWKAWGPASAFASLIGLNLAAALLPGTLWFGTLVTLGATVLIGARAEAAQQKQLAVYRS